MSRVNTSSEPMSKYKDVIPADKIMAKIHYYGDDEEPKTES